MVILGFFVAHWYLSLFTQSFFHHRYAAHKQFNMSRFWEKFFFIISWIFQGSSYLSPYAYGIMHRMHHAYADTEKDVHSPKYDSNFFSMMWRTKTVYDAIFTGKIEVEEKFKKEVPEWHSFDRIASHNISRTMWVVLYALFYLAFATQWWMFLLIPIHAVMGPFHGVIINWFAHKYGYTNFKVKDTSKNLMPVDILMLGEGFHNNHHKNASSPNFGFKWFEFDPIYPIILFFNKLRIIRLAPNR
ncbi:MAG: acyl-CoA desaturase [Saprospirales bacterium]|nr:MAG: acyl-CoA desaturase [Saprospirales bacterium]